LTYDTVPHTVRLPLLFSYVIEHYEFLRAIGTYHILELRPPDHPLNAQYWRSVLGDRIDLGHIPARARLSAYAPIEGDKRRDDVVLTVRYPQKQSARKVTATIPSSDGVYHVQFDVGPDESEYVVNMNRVWFWPLLSKTSLPEITMDDAAALVLVDYRRERSTVLY
jgi:hypothetical protein